jgi:hypothetical protein
VCYSCHTTLRYIYQRKKVCSYLDETHGTHYRVFNLWYVCSVSDYMYVCVYIVICILYTNTHG